MKFMFGKRWLSIFAILLLTLSNCSPTIGYALENMSESTSSSVISSAEETVSKSETTTEMSQSSEEIVEMKQAEENTETNRSDAPSSSQDLADNSEESVQKILHYEDEYVTADLNAYFGNGVENFSVTLPRMKNSGKWDSEREYVNQLSQYLVNQNLQPADVQQIEISDSQIVKEGYKPRLTVNFKTSLGLRGGLVTKENLRLVSTNTDGSLVFHDAEFHFDTTGTLIGLTYEGILGKDIHVVMVKPLAEKTTVTLGQYVQMQLDGYVLEEEEEQTASNVPLNARLKVKIFRSDASGIFTILSPIDSFREEKTFDVLSTWKPSFNLLGIESEKFDIVKMNYRQAHQSKTDSLMYFNGEFPVASFHQESGEEESNVLEIYLQNRMLEGTGMILGLRTRMLGYRSFSGFRSVTNATVSNSSVDQAHITQSKRIDYLGDGGNNPDTSVDDRIGTDTHELYRMYLDMTGTKEPFDTLIVVDRSTSMTDPMNSVDTQARYLAVYKALNGTAGRQGLLSKLVGFHPENQVAIVGFQGYPGYPSGDQDSTVIANWGRSTSVALSNIQPPYNNGTNYTAGLRTAGVVLDQNQSSRKKVMIFISDGVPTFAFVNGVRYGNGTIRGNNPYYTRDWTLNYFNSWIGKYPKLPIYTLGISSEFGNSDNLSANPYVLNHMSSQTGGFYSHVADSQALERTLQKIVDDTKLSLVSINDQLSQYVSYYAEQPDVKVVQTNRQTGQVTTLYQNGAVTSQGVGILQSVTHTAVNASDSTGKVDLNFVDNFKIDDTYTYTISYNVKVTDRAYEEKKTSGYNAHGDSGTDYTGNSTSSGQAGFRSNKVASLTYIRNEQPYEKEYDHPVVQVDTRQFTLQKSDSKETNLLLENVRFELRLSDKKTVFASGETDSRGNITFTDLRRAKTYYLYETKAKDGYTLPEDPWTVDVAVDGTITIRDQLGYTVSKSGEQYRVVNHKLYQLPSTGGYGPAVYILLGVMVITLASYLFYEKRKQIA
ncbi:VWA domain-containing protein [Streptococcus suis]|nr:VWA domain-containing protein [Streptococcus suis]